MLAQKEDTHLEDYVMGSEFYRFIERRAAAKPNDWQEIMVPPSHDPRLWSGKMHDMKLWEAFSHDMKQLHTEPPKNLATAVDLFLKESKLLAYAATRDDNYCPELISNKTLTPDARNAYLADVTNALLKTAKPTPARPNPWAQAFRNAVAAMTLLIPLSIGGYFAARADVEQEVKKQQALAEARYTSMVRAEIESYIPRIKEEVANAFDEYLDKNSDALRDKLIESIAAYVREHPEQLYDPQVGRAVFDGISNDKELMNEFGKQMFTDLMNDEALMNELGQRLRRAIFGR